MIKLVRTFRTALVALSRTPGRAMLTTLGIIIGVAAVIAIIEIGQGSSAQIQKTILTMGANNLIIFPGNMNATGGVRGGAGTNISMTPMDAEAIQRECPAIKAVAPIVWARAQVVYGNRNWVPRQLIGSTPDALEVYQYSNLDQGVCFTDEDVQKASRVCLMGATTAKVLFGEESPLGKEIRVKGIGFKVIGLLPRKGANIRGQDQDDVLITPWTTMRYRVTGTSVATPSQSTSSGATSLSNPYPSSGLVLYPAQASNQFTNSPMSVRFTNVDIIVAECNSTEEIPQAMSQVTALLRERHHLPASKPDDFTVRNISEVLAVQTSTSRLMTTTLLCVASISLLVGGVGIMNIMLVSVTERTREIGLRMAVGARGSDILKQFLIEAVVLCLVGGAMGIAVGRFSSYLIALFLEWPIKVSIPAIFAAVAVSACVGVIFGFYPAWKASRLDPIEALRFES